MKKRVLRSIGVKTLLSHLLLAIGAILVAGALSYLMAGRYVRESRVAELEKKARRIAESAEPQPDGALVPSHRAVKIYQSLTDSAMFILEPDTEDLRMSKYRPGEAADGDAMESISIRSEGDRELAMRVLAGETVSTVRRLEFIQSTVIFAAAPVYDGAGAVCGGVVLAQTLDEMRAFSRGIGMILLAVAVASLPLAVLLGTHLTRRLVRPIVRITEAARRMANDEGCVERITQLPDDEIGDLGRTLNCMSRRLTDVIGNLRGERDKLELLISNMGEGVFAVDDQWGIMHANAAFLELMELESVGRALEWRDEGMVRLRGLIAKCMRTGRDAVDAWDNPSGRALEVTARALWCENGALMGTVCLLRDASESRRMEQLRRDYVANVSHELRTPLTGIRGMVEPLIDGVMETEEERQACCQVILKETIRLEKLVGEMLDMSRLQDGRVTLELEPLELPGILDAAARSMQRIADASGVELRVETDGSRLACVGNEDRITQVLVILIDNALSFTPAGGVVTVFGRDAGDQVAVGVRDNGCGIEPKDLPFIWERFYKADKSRMRTTGTGLGLSIAKLVTELMGGAIDVVSESGKGSEFTFTLNKP